MPRSIRVVVGLGLCGGSLVLGSWALYHLLRTGSCASGGNFVSVRPCPADTGLHILSIFGAVFAGLAGIGIYPGATDSGGRARLGLMMWVLLFVLTGASAVVGAFGAGASGDSGAKLGAGIVAGIFIPMGLIPLLVSRSKWVTKPRSVVKPPPAWATAALGPEPAPQIQELTNLVARVASAKNPERELADRLTALKSLHTQGLVTDAEYEAKKAELLKDL